VEQESARCLKIVTSFLKFARASTGNMEPVDINEVLDEVTRVLKHQLSIHNVQLAVTRGENVPQVLGNGGELQQVLLNLAINAQQAMPRGGSVDITSKRDPFGGAVLTVQDTGPGIPENLRGKIFEPFFTTKAPGEGTGLGLSVSFSIIQAHHGTIEVTSEAGRGTTFTIWLPAA
jgi:two-component system NtrC family sensor kinase